MDIDLNTAEMTAEFLKAPVYRKRATVLILPALAGEEITTVTADVADETTVIAAEGDPVIHNPGGERYIPIGKWEGVSEKYDALGGNMYRAKGCIRAFPNPYSQEVSITAPWGTKQTQGPDSRFAMAVDSANLDQATGDRYLIGGPEFTDTYALLIDPLDTDKV